MSFSIKDFSGIKKIGTGGMGNVYLATQISLDRKVVIKELPPNMLEDPVSIKRFENEAKSAAGLDHENIIRVFDFGEDRHSFFISMEYIDGMDLEQLMRFQPFPREIGLMILLQAMKGLNYAHKQGIVHCDIKPGNILVSKTGKVKVFDFGLAHSRARAAEFLDSSSVFITPGYMPPEMAGGNQSQEVYGDIWSTGVLAYRIMSGVLPFVSKDMKVLVYSIVHTKEKDIRLLVPTLPYDLGSAVGACLEKNPLHRPASLDQLIESLENYLYDLGVKDVEKMIRDYIADKDSVDREISGLLLHYHLRKGNDFLDAGNRAFSEAHFRESEKYGAIDLTLKDAQYLKRGKGFRPRQRIVNPRRNKPGQGAFSAGKPRSGARDIFAPLKTARTAISVIGFIAIAVLGTASVFTMVQKKQNGEPQAQLGPVKPTLDMQNQVKTASAAEDPVNDTVAARPAMVQEPAPAEDDKVILPKPAAFQKAKPAPGTAGPGFGTLRINVEPANASVFVDGKKVPNDQLSNGKRLKPGHHIVTASADGYSSVRNVLSIGANASQFADIALPRLETGTGMLHVHSYPWADMYVDNIFKGTAPTQTPISLAAGEHSLTLTRDGYKTYSGTIHVEQGEITRVKVQLEQ